MNLTEAYTMKSQIAYSTHLSCLIKSFCRLIVIACFITIPVYAAESEVNAPAVKVFDRIVENENEPQVEESDDDGNSETTTQEPLVEDNRTTAEKLEDLKQDVLAVNRDLFILEEDLLFPASTQLATYFSVDVGYFFALDNIKIKIDDKQVSHHLYTEKDVDALHRGAIQKLYIGNINSGDHEIVAILIGKGPRKRAYRRAISFKFTKGTEAKALEIQLRDDESKLQPDLKVIEW